MKGFKITGTHVKNKPSDMMTRAEMIRRYCSFGSKFELVREPDNEWDPNAVAVYQRFKSGGRAQVGYVPSRRAAEIAPLLDDGRQLKVRFGMKIIDETSGEYRGMMLRFVEGG